eukprot:scaffold43033_cov19-Tisochrysis_lutea.AAC.3
MLLRAAMCYRKKGLGQVRQSFLAWLNPAFQQQGSPPSSNMCSGAPTGTTGVEDQLLEGVSGAEHSCCKLFPEFTAGYWTAFRINARVKLSVKGMQ